MRGEPRCDSWSPKDEHGFQHSCTLGSSDHLVHYNSSCGGWTDTDVVSRRPRLPQDPEGHLAPKTGGLAHPEKVWVDEAVPPYFTLRNVDGTPAIQLEHIQMYDGFGQPLYTLPVEKQVNVAMNDLVLAYSTTDCSDDDRIVAAALELAQQFPAIWRSIINDTEES